MASSSTGSASSSAPAHPWRVAPTPAVPPPRPPPLPPRPKSMPVRPAGPIMPVRPAGPIVVEDNVLIEMIKMSF